MQLEELEILSSIFSGPRELVIDDPGIIVDMRSFIEGDTAYLNRQLDYRVHVTLSGFKHRLEIFAELPHYYPALELPNVTISYPNITTTQHGQLKALAGTMLTDLQQTEGTFLFQFISSIQDNEEMRKVLLNEANTTTLKSARPLVPSKGIAASLPDKLERLWIYSHHIKNKRKRAYIIERAGDRQLTGFVLPGKPGIICVEGYQRDTQEFWRAIKAMHWQRIQLRLEETAAIEDCSDDDVELNRFRKFNRFEEDTNFTVVVNGHAGGGGASGHNNNDSDDENLNNNAGAGEGEVLRLNMSTFTTFLEQHNCGHVMSSLFGFKQ